MNHFRSRISRRISWCITLACILAGRMALAGGGAPGYLVIYNPNNPGSVTIANYYQKVRGIPEQNMLPFTGSFSSVWDVIQAVKTKIGDQNFGAQFQGIALIGDRSVPGGVGIKSGDVASYTTYLATFGPSTYSKASPPSDYAGNPAYRSYPYTPVAWTATTAVNGVTIWPISYVGNTGSNGNSPKEVLAYIDRAKSHDAAKPNGTIYWPLNSDIRSSTRQAEIAEQWPLWKKLGIKASVLSNTQWVSAAPDIQGGVCGFMSANTTAGGNIYLPGAWVDHLTSYGGVLNGAFSNTDGQMPISAWIRAGADGSSGTMTEPYAVGWRFTNASIHGFLRQGLSLGEAYWESIQDPDMNNPLGDPLLQPYADFPVVAISAPASGAQVSGSIAINVTAQPTGGKSLESKLDLFVDGHRVAIGQPGETIMASRTAGGFSFDSTTIEDGWHELRVVAYNNDAIRTQGEATISIMVGNRGQAIALSGPSTVTITPAAGTVQFTVVPTGFTDLTGINIRMNGRTLLTTPLPATGGTATVSTTLFPLSGVCSLYAVGTRSNGRQVWSAPLDVTPSYPAVASLNPAPALKNAYANVRYFASTTAAGFNWDSSTPDVTTVYAGDPTNGADLTATAIPGISTSSYTTKPGYQVDMLFNAPGDDWYEFASASPTSSNPSPTTVSVAVDGNVVPAPANATAPQHLAPGWHRLRYRFTVPSSNWEWQLWVRGGYSQSYRSPVSPRIAAEADGSSQAPPQITSITPAANPVTGKTVGLTAVATNPAGAEGDLVYLWARVSGPGSVSFSPNGTNAAKNTTATFSQAGSYVLGLYASQQTASGGLATSSVLGTVSVTVQPTASSINLTESGGTSITVGFPYDLRAVVVDQFGFAASPQGAITWSANTKGTITPVTGTDGHFATYVASATGSTTITAKSGSLTATTSSITIGSNAGPSISGLTVTAGSPASVRMSVSDAQDPNGMFLSYSWTVNSVPAGQTLTFQNADTAAAQLYPSGPGSYKITAIVTDLTQHSASKSIVFTVDAQGAVVSGTLPYFAVNPSSISVYIGESKSFSCEVFSDVTLQWQVSTDSGTTWTDIAGATGRYLKVGPVAAADNSKKYRVIATSTAGSTTSSVATLTVSNPSGGVIEIFGPQDGGSQDVAEVDGQFVITFRRVGNNTGTLSAHFYLLNYSGAFQSNITIPSGLTLTNYDGVPAYTGTITWAGGDSADKRLVFGLVKDGVAEGVAHLDLYADAVTAGTGAIGNQYNPQIIDVHDNDGPGEISFAQPNYTVREDGKFATLTLKRSYSFSGTMTVNYAMASKSDGPSRYGATDGLDFVSGSGSVTWGDQDSADKQITVPILSDGMLSGNKDFNVTISLPSGIRGGYDGYTSAPTDSITSIVTIADAPIYAWANAWWPGVSNRAVTGPQADPDEDGLSNIIEYALGLNPTVASLNGRPQTATVNGHLQMTFTRLRDASDVVYQVDASSNLTDWTEIWSSANVPYGGGDQPSETVTVQDPVDVSVPGATPRFLRLRVTQ